jgi:hypothetical protein
MLLPALRLTRNKLPSGKRKCVNGAPQKILAIFVHCTYIPYCRRRIGIVPPAPNIISS